MIFIPKYTGRCDTCGRDVPREQIAPADFEQLEAEYHYAEFSDELKWLRRVEAFYQRHPEAVGNVKPHAMCVLEAKHEPSIMRKLFAGMPLSEIAVPPPTRPVSQRSEKVSPTRDHFWSIRSSTPPPGATHICSPSCATSSPVNGESI